MHSEELIRLAREINKGEENIQEFRTQIETRLRLAGPEMILQGQRLIRAKSLVPIGQWYNWLKANCPSIKQQSACLYMLRARRADENVALAKELHLLCDGDSASSTKPAAAPTWPTDLQGVQRLARTCDWFARHPIRRWPEPARERLRELLAPLARELWPRVILE